MPEPFKNFISTDVIKNMAFHFKRNWPDFNDQAFISMAVKDLDSLELKQRTDRVTESMQVYFPADFEKACDIIQASLGPPLLEGMTFNAQHRDGIVGWAITPLTHYVGLQGLAHFELSMELFKILTQRFSSEFGIRFFLLAEPEKTLEVLRLWARDSNYHVRRLSSEGARPRLPWAMRLPDFIEDPLPLIDLLELLKDDEHEYVRRSVANNLNDIAKDHPDLIAEVASRWMQQASKDRVKLVRHACRTLIKSGHQQTLNALGYKAPELRLLSFEVLTPVVKFGGDLKFALSIESASKIQQPLIIDYVIHHQKANGKTTPKVFKWRSTNLLVNKKLDVAKKHAIKKISTRVYYPGEHKVEVMVNGESIAIASFELSMLE